MMIKIIAEYVEQKESYLFGVKWDNPDSIGKYKNAIIDYYDYKGDPKDVVNLLRITADKLEKRLPERETDEGES